jgi:hypothetical protein
MASHPSFTTNGTRITPAIGSASGFLKTALASSPAKAIHERYPQAEDCAASASRDAAESCLASFRFCLASHGIPTAANISRPIPIKLGRGSPYPRSDLIEMIRTNAATRNSNAPQMRAAVVSARTDSEGALDRNRHRTTIAEMSSMALSPPKPRRAGLRAFQADVRAAMASPIIQTMVRICRRWARLATSAVEARARVATVLKILLSEMLPDAIERGTCT